MFEENSIETCILSRVKNTTCFFLSHCCQSPFPLWESQPTSPHQDAFQHYASLWTCCGGYSDSNPVLLLCVLAFSVHSYQNQCVFFCGSSQCLFTYSIDTEFAQLIMQFVQLMGRFWVFFLCLTAPGFQWWFYFHLCMWAVHWGLLLMLPWQTWVCLSEGQVWRWCSSEVTGVLAAPGTQGSWRLGQQKIQCSRRVWQPVLVNNLLYSCLEKPL